MKLLVCLLLTLAMALCLVVATESRAWGYVDPGSGLLTLQAAASAMATAFYFASRHIRNLFLRRKGGPALIPETSAKANDLDEVAWPEGAEIPQ